jgi:hypothetical protein
MTDATPRPVSRWLRPSFRAWYFSAAALLILLPALFQAFFSPLALAPLAGVGMVVFGLVRIRKTAAAPAGDLAATFRAKLVAGFEKEPAAPCLFVVGAPAVEPLLAAAGITALSTDDATVPAPFRVVAGRQRRGGGDPRPCGLVVWTEPDDLAACRTLGGVLKAVRGGEVPLHGVVVFGNLGDDRAAWERRARLLGELFQSLGVQCPVRVAVSDPDLDAAVARLLAETELPRTNLAVAVGPIPPGQKPTGATAAVGEFIDGELPTRTLAAFGAAPPPPGDGPWSFPEQLDPEVARQFRLASAVNALWRDGRDAVEKTLFAVRDEGASGEAARPHRAEFAVVPSWAAGANAHADLFGRALDDGVWATWSAAAVASAGKQTDTQRRGLMADVLAVAAITVVQVVLIVYAWNRR